MRSLVLGLLAVISGAATAMAEEFPYGPTHVFAVYRQGQPIGTHSLNFQGSGDRRTVTTAIDFSVKALGLTVYRYMHRGEEVWSNGAFQSLATRTDDNGTKLAIRARRENDGIAVTREGADRQVLPAQTLPSTHWNAAQVRQSAMLNSQNGDLSRVRIVRGQQEAIKTTKGTLVATRYSYSGDVTMDQWFDERSRWVKTTFKASDGSTIEYILDE